MRDTDPSVAAPSLHLEVVPLAWSRSAATAGSLALNQTPDVACRATAEVLVGGTEDAVGPAWGDGCWDEGLWVMGREAVPPDKLSLCRPGRPKETERLVRNLSTEANGFVAASGLAIEHHIGQILDQR